MNCVVLGAGGFLGVNLVERLLAEGIVPRCGRRARSNVIKLRSLKVPLVPADLDEPEQLAAAMAGAEVVFHAAGHYPRLSLDKDGAIATGRRQMQNVLDAAAGAGVARLIYVSSTATVAPNPIAGAPSTEVHRHPVAPGFGTYHDLKWTMEEMALAERRLAVSVALPGACVGPWDLRVGTSALMVGLARGMDPPHPDGFINLVDTRDVALALLRLAQHPSPPPRVLLGGKNLLLHQLLLHLAERYQVARPSPPLGAEEAVRLADAEEHAAVASGRSARPKVVREIVDLINHGVPIDCRLAETTLGMRWRGLDDSLDAFDAWARRMRILPDPASHKEASP